MKARTSPNAREMMIWFPGHFHRPCRGPFCDSTSFRDLRPMGCGWDWTCIPTDESDYVVLTVPTLAYVTLPPRVAV